MPETTPTSSDYLPISVTSDTGYFAQVPEWLLAPEVSGNAVKLYAILRRYADRLGSAWPSRATLAQRLGFAKVGSVDPVLKELVALGALQVTPRYDDNGARTSSAYLLIAVRAGRPDPAPQNGQGGPAERIGVAPQTGQGQPRRTDTRREPLNSEPLNSESARAKKKPAIPLPADWTPSAEHAEYAATAGYDLEREADAFRMDARAKDRRYVEWNSAFAKWLRSPYPHNQLATPATRKRRNFNLDPVL